MSQKMRYVLVTTSIGELGGAELDVIELSAENVVDIRSALRHAEKCSKAYKAEVFDETYEKWMKIPIPVFDY